MTKDKGLSKNIGIREKSKDTKQKRKSQVCRVYRVKIDFNTAYGISTLIIDKTNSIPSVAAVLVHKKNIILLRYLKQNISVSTVCHNARAVNIAPVQTQKI